MHFVALFIIKLVALVATLVFVGIGAVLWYKHLNKKYKHPHLNKYLLAAALCGMIVLGISTTVNKVPSFDYFMRTIGPADGPQMPLNSAIKFLKNMDAFREVNDIAQNPAAVPEKQNSNKITYSLESEEVLHEVAPGVYLNSWTFNGQIPGPFLRAKVGDEITIQFKNKETSLHEHNIDFHAVTGPGGGAAVLTARPGEEKTLTFTALNPGLYVYHCAVPNVGVHMTHGLYGLIFIEPPEGLPPVDKEFYLMQGEFYTAGEIGKKGLQVFDVKKYLSGDPTYVVFNGRSGSTAGKMYANLGDKVRLYVGNGGVNLVSSFHVIGEIFDTVYPEGGTPVHHDIQSTIIPAGGAIIVEFTVDLPGKYILVDHALARLDKGAWGVLEVTGEWNATIYSPQPQTSGGGH